MAFSICLFLSSCLDDDEPKKDVTNEINMTISSETGTRQSWESDKPVECMLMKSDDNPDKWEKLSMGAITGFTYQKGHEYELRVLRTILGNPPADAYEHVYSLVKIISDKDMTHPK